MNSITKAFLPYKPHSKNGHSYSVHIPPLGSAFVSYSFVLASKVYKIHIGKDTSIPRFNLIIGSIWIIVKGCVGNFECKLDYPPKNKSIMLEALEEFLL